MNTSNSNPLQPLQLFVEQYKDDGSVSHDFLAQFYGDELIKRTAALTPADFQLFLVTPLAIRLLGYAVERILEENDSVHPQYYFRFWAESIIDLNAKSKKFTCRDGLWTLEVLEDGSVKLSLVIEHPCFFEVVAMLSTKMHMVGLGYDGQMDGVETDEAGYASFAPRQLLQDFTLTISREEWAHICRSDGGTFHIYQT